jgi:hypothetical protein
MWLIAAVAVVVLALGGVLGVKAATGGGGSSSATASAQNGGPGGAAGARRGGQGTFGTLQSVDGSTLTIAGPNGNTTTVLTSSSTKFAKAVTGAVGDIKVGDHVMARGTADGANALSAQRITDTGTDPGLGARGQGRRPGGNGNGNPPGSIPANGPAANGAPPNGGPGTSAFGTVKSINGTSFDVAQTDGTTKTVNTTSSTTVQVLKAISLQELVTGQPVTVRGTTNSDGTVTAAVVQQGLGGFGPGRGGPPGTGNTGA